MGLKQSSPEADAGADAGSKDENHEKAQHQSLGPTNASITTDSSFQVQQSSLPILQEAPVAPTLQAKILCGVCDTTQSKYKCPQCYLPYCSVACNKVHKQNHPHETKIKSPAKVHTAEVAVGTPDSHELPPDPTNPFRALDSSEKLQHLLRKYPGLGQQLIDIYAATQPPQEAPDKKIPASLMRGVARKDAWNYDVGIKNGKAALQKARRTEGEAGDGIREYSELILHLTNGQDDRSHVSTLLQQKAAEEDSKLIEQLMTQERR